MPQNTVFCHNSVLPFLSCPNLQQERPRSWATLYSSTHSPLRMKRSQTRRHGANSKTMEQRPLLCYSSYHWFQMIPHIWRLHRDSQAAPSVFRLTTLPSVTDQHRRGTYLTLKKSPSSPWPQVCGPLTTGLGRRYMILWDTPSFFCISQCDIRVVEPWVPSKNEGTGRGDQA